MLWNCDGSDRRGPVCYQYFFQEENDVDTNYCLHFNFCTKIYHLYLLFGYVNYSYETCLIFLSKHIIFVYLILCYSFTQVDNAHDGDVHCVDWNTHDINLILTVYATSLFFEWS